MTFKNLKELNTTESRSCALVFNFNNKELIKIKRITVYQTSIFSPIYLKINDEIESSDNDIIVDNTESN